MGAHPDGEKDAVSLTDSFGRLALALELYQSDFAVSFDTTRRGEVVVVGLSSRLNIASEQ